MKVISFVATKGGVGKTTLSYQFGNYLAKEKNKRVLFLDFDSQRSLSSLYDIPDNINHKNTGDLLLSEDFVEPIKVDKNIDLIPSSVRLGNNILHEIALKANKELLLYMWIGRNIEKLNYDYIISDCNPAWNLVTMNVVSASDIVISPLEPSGFGYDSHDKVLSGINELKKVVVEPVTKKPYVIAEVYFIANLIKHNTTSSREFLNELEKYDDILGMINEKEVLNSSMLSKQFINDYILENKKLSQERKFLNQLYSIFDKIIEL